MPVQWSILSSYMCIKWVSMVRSSVHLGPLFDSNPFMYFCDSLIQPFLRVQPHHTSCESICFVGSLYKAGWKTIQFGIFSCSQQLYSSLCWLLDSPQKLPHHQVCVWGCVFVLANWPKGGVAMGRCMRVCGNSHCKFALLWICLDQPKVLKYQHAFTEICEMTTTH